MYQYGCDAHRSYLDTELNKHSRIFTHTISVVLVIGCASIQKVQQNRRKYIEKIRYKRLKESCQTIKIAFSAVTALDTKYFLIMVGNITTWVKCGESLLIPWEGLVTILATHHSQ